MPGNYDDAKSIFYSTLGEVKKLLNENIIQNTFILDFSEYNRSDTLEYVFNYVFEHNPKLFFENPEYLNKFLFRSHINTPVKSVEFAYKFFQNVNESIFLYDRRRCDLYVEFLTKDTEYHKMEQYKYAIDFLIENNYASQ